MRPRWFRSPLILVVGSAAAAALAVAAALLASRPSHADIVPGEYSLEVNITPTQADLGAQFTAKAGIFYGETPSDCSVTPTPFGCYQAVQWDIDYDESLVSVVSMTRDTASGAPANCATKNDNGTRVLLGCIDITGPNLEYSGNAWNVVFQCNASNPGNADFILENTSGATASTFVKVGTTREPIHTHDDSIFCGPPPATETPTPTATSTSTASATKTPSGTPTRTRTPTRTPTPTPTIPVPPGQDQFQQVLFDPTAAPSGQAFLNGIESQMKTLIGQGWDVVDSTTLNLDGADRVVYSLQRSARPQRGDVNGDNFIDLTDVLLILQDFGKHETSTFRHVVIDPGSQPNGQALLNAIDAEMEGFISQGWDVVDSTTLTLDGNRRIVFALQLHNIPRSSDVDGDGIVDLADALIALSLFNTALPPVAPEPVPSGPDQFQQILFDPGAAPNGQAFLNGIDSQMETQIAQRWDVVDSTTLNLDNADRVVYSLQLSARPHRADANGDNFIDLTDALLILNDFGKHGISAFRHVVIDPDSQPNGQALLNEMDAEMEGFISQGWDVVDSTTLTLDGNRRIVFALQLHNIPPNSDVNGDGIVDLTDVMIVLSLFNTVP
jgi:hypothetical protein